MNDIQILTDAEKDSVRRGGKILRGCLDFMATLVEPGITTQELDEKAEEFIRSHEGATPAFKGYQGYPATLCTSVNEQCVHGIPSNRELKEGDIIAIDCGVLLDELYTDACITVPVGRISSEAQLLLDTTQHALNAALKIVRKNTKVGDISATIQKIVEDAGFRPVRSLTGHGLGKTLHQFPDIPNLGTADMGAELPVGALIAIEPIVSMGSDEVVDSSDGWTLSIRDKALSAHFEHTILVKAEDYELIA
jgi:methionyl aminopeptidase